MGYYRLNLPHWQPEGAEYFVTFRLADSLPPEIVLHLKRRRKELLNQAEHSSRSTDRLSVLRRKVHRHIFKKYELLLDKGKTGPTWLENDAVAEIVREALHYRDKKQYDLYAYCLMPNHVHVVLRLLRIKQSQKMHSYPLAKVLQSLKWYTALQANKILNREGSFWQPESYDHVIRDQNELERIIGYTLNNPVKAGLVGYWKDWPYSYYKSEFVQTF